MDRLCEKLLDRVILVSEATRWAFAPHSKQTLIYNGVELSALRPPLSPPRWRGGKTLRTDLNLDPDALLIGIVTRITPEKGIHLLIEATAKLKASPYIQLLVVGGPYFPKDAEYIDSLKVQAEKLGIADRVIFTGFLEDIRVRFYPSLTLFCSLPPFLKPARAPSSKRWQPAYR